MGKGDSRSRRGKIFKGTYGKSRPHKVASAKKVAPKKTAKAAKK